MIQIWMSVKNEGREKHELLYENYETISIG